MRGRSSGFSLAELVIALTVVGLLLALVIPAVQSSREASRNAACKNKLRQIGTACLSYEAAYGNFPPSNAGRIRNGGAGSYLIGILPFLEQSQLATYVEHFDHVPEPSRFLHNVLSEIEIPFAKCPSDAEANRSSTNYLGNSGTGVDLYGLNGMFRVLSEDVRDGSIVGGRLKFADVVDGTSQTAMIAEKALGPQLSDDRKIPLWDLPTYYQPNRYEDMAKACNSIPVNPRLYGWRGSNHPTTWFEAYVGSTLYNHVLSPNSPTCKNGQSYVAGGAITASSHHPGGANVVFADGHLTFASQDLDIDVWREMGSRVDNALPF